MTSSNYNMASQAAVNETPYN